jgi:hypothetical protein
MLFYTCGALNSLEKGGARRDCLIVGSAAIPKTTRHHQTISLLIVLKNYHLILLLSKTDCGLKVGPPKGL